MRAFIAIELPPAQHEALASLSARLRRSGAPASWVRPENMHLTLRFLGEVAPDVVEAIAAHLTEPYGAQAPFTLRLHGAGAFPNPRRPAVIWAGIAPLDGPLAEVQASAEQAAQAVGLAPERKPFHPHVTLARLRDPSRAQRLTTALRDELDFDGGEFRVRHVSLFSSQLTPTGPVYQRVSEVPLCSAGPAFA